MLNATICYTIYNICYGFAIIYKISQCNCNYKANHHRSKHPSIKASFRNSSQLGLVKTPTLEGEDGTRVLNTQCRFFTDDIPYGLLLAKWVAEQLDVKTPHLNVVIMWAQKLRGEHWLNDDSTIDMEFCTKHKHHSGLPPTYGINNVDEILD